MPQSQTSNPAGDARPTILLSANSSWNIFNFRLGLITALQGRGFKVAVAAPADDHAAALRKLGIDLVPLAIDSSGASPVRDLRLLAGYYRVLRRIRPAAFLGFTAKPNIYGSIAAAALGIRVINNISGLGTAFIEKTRLTKIVSALYRIALKRSSTVFFQNRDDCQLFTAAGLVTPDQARLLPGSGIDLDRFRPSGQPRAAGPFRFLFVGRLLWDKGLAELVEAARMVRHAHPEVRFQLLGAAGVANRTAVPADTLQGWIDEGLVEYLGADDDVRRHIDQADCLVLPSYREGLPKALLEGSAMGKPVIATDVPGCRDVVDDGRTGFLCEVRSARSLAEAMIRMIACSAEDRQAMGELGRRKVELEFCQSRVIDKYLEALERR